MALLEPLTHSPRFKHDTNARYRSEVNQVQAILDRAEGLPPIIPKVVVNGQIGYFTKTVRR